METNEKSPEGLNFLEQIITGDLENKTYNGRVHTRFPPEPNGYLHIGHAQAICLNFGLAEKFGGKCNLRFDDTNPATEEVEFVESIKEDIRWLGFDWEDRLYFASDYFDTLYGYAIKLIKQGNAYVCSLSAEEVRQNRGTPSQPGIESPYRNRSVEENLDLLERMKNGEFEDGTHILRAKIGMNSPNMQMRDPAIYRIRKARHHRTGDQWCIYPMYDFAHGQSDYIEGITHSICTLEFVPHRELYDWLLDHIAEGNYRPRQYEFARLNVSYMITSKRKLLQLVEEGHASGWNDPRMPTISGLRRRGYTPESVRSFVARAGVAKRDGISDIALLEFSVREHLNKTANRVMGVLKPLRIVIENYPENEEEWLEAVNNPEDESAGSRKIPFSKVLYIEQDDFMEEPPRKFFRLGPGREVRLRYAYFVTCNEIVKDEKTGEIKELICSYDPASKGGKSPDGRKVKGTLHWVSAKHALNAEVRLYDRLFSKENPAEDENVTDNLNAQSLEVLGNCKLEPSLTSAGHGDKFQFERLGYFCVDPYESSEEKPVFNRTVSLRDSWAKIAGK